MLSTLKDRCAAPVTFLLCCSAASRTSDLGLTYSMISSEWPSIPPTKAALTWTSS